MTDLQAKLLPCPFCGGDPTPDHSAILARMLIFFTARNGDCPAWPNVSGATEAEAITAWNTRAPVAAPTGDAVGEAVERVINFLNDFSSADLDELAADGGVTVGMVFQQQAKWEATKLARATLTGKDAT